MGGGHAGGVVSPCVLTVLRWHVMSRNLDVTALPPDHCGLTGPMDASVV
jgi:hypothetical protein